MNTEEKIYSLMAQAEDMQAHAEKLQNGAEETFKALPLAVEQAGKEIRSTGLQMALMMLGVGIIVCGISIAFMNWSTSSLREERATLKAAIQAEEATLAEMKSKTWGLSLHEESKGCFIVLPKGTLVDTEKIWTVNDNSAIRIIK